MINLDPVRNILFSTCLSAWRGPVPMAMGGVGGGRMAFAAMDMAAAPERMMVRKGAVPAPPELKKPERVRKLFPETWLWQTSEAM